MINYESFAKTNYSYFILKKFTLCKKGVSLCENHLFFCDKKLKVIINGYFQASTIAYTLLLVMRKSALFFLTFIFPVFICAQSFKGQQVYGLASEEVYDLLHDKNGFLWIGHALGITRFDGINYVDFQNEKSTGLGMTDLCVDKQGRIWCHNFNGQIFFIENEKMNLLTSFNNNAESSFPRMLILEDELVVSSEKGLFIHNTKTNVSRYIYYHTQLKRGRTLAAVRNRVYEFNGESWIRYEAGKPIQEIAFRNATDFPLNSLDAVLQPLSTIDTIYAKDIKGTVLKFTVNKDTILLSAVSHEENFVNTITQQAEKKWINTTKGSHTSDYSEKIDSVEFSDISVDREGNKWYSSLSLGLWVDLKQKFWSENKTTELEKSDFIIRFKKINHYSIYGTQKGNLIVKITEDNKSKKVWQLKLPPTAGMVENIFPLFENEWLIAPSLGLYLYNSKTNSLYEISNQSTVKGIALTKTDLFIAYSRSLAYLNIQSYQGLRNKNYSAYIAKFISDMKQVVTIKAKKCLSVCYDHNAKKVFAAFKDGLFEIPADHSAPIPIYYNNNVIPAVALSVSDKQLYISTYYGGLFVMHQGKLKNISVINDMMDAVIMKIRFIDGKLYLIQTSRIQVLDEKLLKITNTISSPSGTKGLIYDLWKEDSLLYIATNNYSYHIPLELANSKIKPPIYLLAENDQGKLHFIEEKAMLPFSQNSIQFKMGSPSMYFPKATYFQYRIIGTSDSTWHQTSPNENTISYSALNPGEYVFQTYATNFQNNKSIILSFPFKIMKPWWMSWWSICLVILSVTLLISFLVKQQLKNNRIQDQRTIDALQLRSDLRNSLLTTIKSQMNPHFLFNSLNTIQSFMYNDDRKSMSKYMGKFSELIRNILDNSNKQEITLTEEIEVLKLYLSLEQVRFENNLLIQFEVAEQLDTENFSIPPMMVQPYIENSIIHGLFHKQGDKVLSISIKQSTKLGFVDIFIEDNGIGRKLSQQLNKQRKNHTSFANSANGKRIELINQTLEEKIKVEIIDKVDESGSPAGTIVILSIPSIESTY